MEEGNKTYAEFCLKKREFSDRAGWRGFYAKFLIFLFSESEREAEGERKRVHKGVNHQMKLYIYSLFFLFFYSKDVLSRFYLLRGGGLRLLISSLHIFKTFFVVKKRFIIWHRLNREDNEFVYTIETETSMFGVNFEIIISN